MKIGNLLLENNLILSPMAGYSDIAMRVLCRKYGAGLVCTEMVNAKGLRDENIRAHRIIRTKEEGRPFSIQIFGTEVNEIVRAAKELEGLCDIISFNCGCPAYRIQKSGCGAALLDDFEKIFAITRALKESVKVPIVIKIRLGNKIKCDYVSLCKGIEEAGADAIIVHGRTAAQGYSGKADWEVIGEIKQACEIPIIANGDILDGKSAKKCLEISEADGLFIGRAALGDPKVFERINTYLTDGIVMEDPTAKEKMEMFMEYIEMAVEAEINLPQILHQAQCFTKGIEGASKIRAELNKARSIEDIRKIMDLS